MHSNIPPRQHGGDSRIGSVKGLKVVEVFMEFEGHFGSLSTWNQTILVSNKVVMFLHPVDVLGGHDFGTLLEYVTTESGATDD